MKANRSVRRIIGVFLAGVLVAGLVALTITPAPAEEPLKQQVLVDQARITFKNFIADPDMTWFRDNLKDAKGLLIVPELYKGAFIVGGAGGNGVLLKKDEKTGAWIGPAFYSLGTASLGLQIGGQKSEVINMVMSQKALDSLYTSSFKVGGETSAAMGPVGAGARGNIKADFISFMRSKGAFIGFSLDGAAVNTKEKWNQAYYGKTVTPIDILVKSSVSNPKSADLQKDLAEATKK